MGLGLGRQTFALENALGAEDLRALDQLAEVPDWGMPETLESALGAPGRQWRPVEERCFVPLTRHDPRKAGSIPEGSAVDL
jgi:hypothetical protein